MKALCGIRKALLFLLIFVFVSGCGGGGGGGGGSAGGGGKDTSSSAGNTVTSMATTWNNIPVPDGYYVKDVTIRNGTLDVSLNSTGKEDSKSIQEAYLCFIYHSLYPSGKGNPIPIEVLFSNGKMKADAINSVISYKDNSYKPMATTSESKFDIYYRNHLLSLNRNYALLKTMTLLGRHPEPLSSRVLKNMNKLDENEQIKIDQIGQERSFWITFPTPLGNQNRLCVCRAVGQHCYVYIDKSDDSYYQNRDVYASSMADYFDSTVYPSVRNYVGYEWNPGIDGDPKVYIVLSANIENSYFSFADEYKQDQLPTSEKSNQHEVFYIDPIMFVGQGEKADSQLSVMQAVAGHEFTHMVRFNAKSISGNGGTPIAYSSLNTSMDSEMSINEGCAIFTENVLLNRGITSNSNAIAGLRAGNLEKYLRQTEKSTLTSFSFNEENNHGLGIYEMGFFIVEYLYEKMGYSAISKLNLADGKMGLKSLQVALGSTSIDDFFDMQALAILLSGKGFVSNYMITGVDLSGATRYGSYNLHNPWSSVTNVNDYGNGVDINQINQNKTSMTLYEWSPVFMRFYNGGSSSLNISINGLSVGNGGGNIRAYFFYR